MESRDLKKAGLKATLARMKILEILEESDGRHLTAEDVYKELLATGEQIGLATVYRVLTQFETAGLAIRHHFEAGQAVFELDKGGHHDHLICVNCGRVVEFIDATIESKQQTIAKKLGFKVTDHTLVMYAECQNAKCKHRSKSS